MKRRIYSVASKTFGLAVVVVLVVHQLGMVRNERIHYQGPITEGPETTLPLLSNISVVSYYNQNNDTNLIRLNISWVPVDSLFNTTTVTVSSKVPSGKCVHLSETLNYPIKIKSIIFPSPSISAPNWDQEILAGCVYEIVFHSEEVTDRSNRITYAVPECVGKICDCEKYKPEGKVLKVVPAGNDEFFVQWDPGYVSSENKPYNISDVDFSLGKNLSAIYSTVETLDKNLPAHSSKIKIHKIPKDENYILYVIFSNNYTCTSDDWIEFRTIPESSHYTLIGFILVTIILIIILKHRLIYKYMTKLFNILPSRYNRMVVQETNLPLAQLELQIPMQTNFQYIPAEFSTGDVDEYEFPRNKLVIKEAIGSGAFGQVFSAKAFEIGESGTYTMVAVKTSGDNASREATEDFMAEIEIFKRIGDHPNIVKLLGCCTLEQPYIMIMEFVPCGDLKKYLLELRDQWLKKRTPRIFLFPDNTDGAYIVPDSPTTPVSITSSRLPSTPETACTNLDCEVQTPLLANYNQALEKVLDHNELQNFALQIARGMAHLEKIPITHRDLAARNILINEFKILKISDFGLSRKGPYVNHKLKKLPLRWMALEAIIDQNSNSKSDVWSFGVVLWEIATLGAFPYENILDSFLIQHLQLGNRLERPEICTDELYLLMLRCWEKNPDDRPSFEELVELLDVKKQKVYVDFSQLNPTYVFPPSEVETASDLLGEVRIVATQ